jgi:hypothetical protein
VSGAQAVSRPASVYRASPIKRGRRTGAEITAIKDTLVEILESEHPMTVRQVFYQMVSRGAIGKTEGEYKTTVCRLLTDMRLAGEIPYGWMTDNTRWMRKPHTHGSAEVALSEIARAYRRALWDDQDAYVEIWVEKDALAGVCYDVTEPWDVPLMVTRGYASITFLHEAAEALSAQGRPVHLYYFGDYDPSGVDIPLKVEQRLRQFAPDCDITFQRMAVTPEQIIALNLPTRPTKTSDSRARAFAGKSVELDAIPPAKLREIIDNCITQHVDPDRLARTEMIEREEQNALFAFREAVGVR